jgi:cold shock protein
VSKEKGIVKFFNAQKGYGFITPESGDKDLFVHASNVEGGGADLVEGSKVEFIRGTGRKGPEATDVSVIG